MIHWSRIPSVECLNLTSVMSRLVGSAAEALAICERERFDVVILDYLMPVIKATRSRSPSGAAIPAVPIIMITADAEKLDPSASPARWQWTC